VYFKNRHQQAGMTALGAIILLIPVSLVIYAGIRLTPVYLNYLSVSSTLNALPAALNGQAVGPGRIRDKIERHFEIDAVNYPTAKDIYITRSSDGWQVEAAYDDTATLFAGISLQVQFDKVVTIKSTAVEDDSDDD